MDILIAGCGAQGNCSAGVLAREEDIEQLVPRVQGLVFTLIDVEPGDTRY